MAKKKKKKRLWSELKSQEKKFFCRLISHFAYVYNIITFMIKKATLKFFPPPQAVPHWGWQHHSVLQRTRNGGNGGDHLLTLHPSAVPQTFLSFNSSRKPFLFYGSLRSTLKTSKQLKVLLCLYTATMLKHK